MIRKYTNAKRDIWQSDDGRHSGLVSALSPEDRSAILPPDPPPISVRLAALTTAVDHLVESVAKSLRYKSSESVAGYLNSKVTKYRAEAQAFTDWRDQVWLACDNIEAEVKAGTRLEPTPAELLALLPPWKAPA